MRNDYDTSIILDRTENEYVQIHFNITMLSLQCKEITMVIMDPLTETLIEINEAVTFQFFFL